MIIQRDIQPVGPFNRFNRIVTHATAWIAMYKDTYAYLEFTC